MRTTLFGMMILAAGLALNLQGALQYWDPSASAGYQHGDGVWSTAAGDANWTAVGGSAPLSPFGNTNDVWFNAFGGVSTVTLNTSLTTGVAYVNGSAYAIIVTNGGRIVSSTVALGNANAANGNRFIVAGGAGVTSLWVTGTLRLGGTAAMGATNNIVLVDGKGYPESAMMSNVSLTVGASGGNAGNEMQVIDGGRLMTAGATIGSLSTGNAVRVRDAGSQWSAGGVAVTVGTGAGARGNTLSVEGAAVVTNAAVVTVGTLAGSGGNQLSIAGGGRLYSSGTAVIGLTASSSNSALVTGTGSLWQVSQLTLGSGTGSSGNVLRVENGGVVRCLTGRIWIGESASCNSNQLIIRDGQVYAPAILLGNNQAGQSVSIIGGDGLNSLLDCQGSTLGTAGTGVSGGHSYTIDGGGFPGSAVASNITTVSIAAAGGLCALVVTNQGRLYASGALTVGPGVGNTAVVAQGGKAGAGGFQIAGSNNTLSVEGAGSVLNAGGLNSIIGTAANQTGNTVRVTDGGVITNGGTLGVGAYGANSACALVIGSAGKVFTAGYAGIGSGAGAAGNSVTVRDEGSLWNLGGKNLNVGTNNALTVDNWLVITRTGAVDNVGTLTVYTNNSVSFLGGTLGVVSVSYNNGLFSAGDGAQAAALKSLAAGTLAFNGGLLLNSNAVLSGGGTVSGAGAGVEIGRGARLEPGLDEVGAVAIGGSGLTLDAGGIYRCEIADLAAGPGFGWDWVSVGSQLALPEAGAVIRLDSMGGVPANWNAGADYNLRVLNFGSLAGSVTNVVLDLSGFVPGGAWSVTNANNALYLLYRGSGASYSPTSKWNDPNSGNWSVAENWTPNGQPAGDGTAGLEFGGSGPGYSATNDTGAFALNRLLLTGSGGAGVTNVIAGGTLVFTNADARVDYSGSAAYRITSPSQFKTDLVMDGNGYGGGLVDGPAVTFTNITAAGGLTKKGPWMLVLNGANTFGGPLVVDSPPDGVLRAATNSIGTGNALIVSNGTLWTVSSGLNIFARKGSVNRRGLITGPNSVWTNTASGFYVAEGVTTETTNNILTLSDGATLHAGGGLLVGSSCPRNMLIVTNGGRVYSPASSGVGGSSAGSGNMVLVTGTGSLWNCSTLTIGGGSGNNVLQVERGGQYISSSSITVQNLGSSPSLLLVTNGGIVNCISLQLQNDLAGASSRGLAVVTGTGSVLRLGGGNSGLVRRSGSQGNTLTVRCGGTATNGSWNVAYSEPGAISNGILVANGGRMFCTGNSSLAVTNNCRDNYFQVEGADSLWNNGGGGLNLVSGAGGSSAGNYVRVSDGAVMTNVGALNLATINASTSSNNFVLVDGGVLQAASLTCNNGQPNWVTLDGTGALSLGTLILTNAGQTVTVASGSLTLKNALVSNGVAQVIGDGTQSAALTLLPFGTNDFARGLVISSNAVLGGSGLVAATTTVHGALSPGLAGVGSLVNRGPLGFAGGSGSRFDLAAGTEAGSGWDWLVVTNGPLDLGGLLTPVLGEGFVPEKADRFLIMTNQDGSVTGSFANGGQATAYAGDLKTKLGTFAIEIADQGVVLTGFRAWRSGGTVVVLR
jgi:T5SS/PEP-CTERM-associated repeat protein